jgi:hypothetical protein
MKQQVKQVPYGVSDFATVMSQNLYYVDKTMFLPELEKQPRNLFFIRPRRFGKSLFLSMLYSYLLAVLGEEDEYRTTKWRKFHLGSHYLIQAIYAHVHSYVSLADIVLGTLIQSKHTASSFS